MFKALAFFILSSFQNLSFSTDNFLNIFHAGVFQSILYVLGITAVIAVLVSSPYFPSESALSRKLMTSSESQSKFLLIFCARSSFVRNLVMIRLTGDCLPDFNILIKL